MHIGSLVELLNENSNKVPPSKGTWAGNFSWKGYNKNPNVGMDKNSTAGIINRGINKVTRPIIHAKDLLFTGYDNVMDAVKGTTPGKAVVNKTNEYVNDPEGKHKYLSTALKAGGLYGALVYGNGNNGFLPAALNLGASGIIGYDKYKRSNKRSKMRPEELKKALKADYSKEIRERKERKERMDNFWNDMKL